MIQAAAAWEGQDFGLLDNLLRSTSPTSGSPDFRGWEWYFLHEQSKKPFVRLPEKLCGRQPGIPVKTKLLLSWMHRALAQRSRFWEPSNSTPLRKLVHFTDISTDTITGLRWTADGKRMALATLTGRALVLDVDTRKTLFDQLAHEGPGGRKEIRGFDLTRSGELLATSNFFGKIKLWNVDTGELLEDIFGPLLRKAFSDNPVGFSRNINSLAFSPQGEQLVAAMRYG